MAKSVSELIGVISKASDRYGDKLIKFMDRYGLKSLSEAKAERLEEFIREEKL